MIAAIVTDIEGTTTPISFVTETLFPYARTHLPAFVVAHHQEPAIAALLAETRHLAGAPDLDLDGTIAILCRWIDEDRKATPLKTLQGLIWDQGYRGGTLKGAVYPDAALALRQWHQSGIRLYVYSSGSVMAQKLIFGFSSAGDLTPLFSGYFDTTTGPKLAEDSYRAIEAAISVSARAILFLSDHPGELDAAAAAGFKTAWLQREGASAVVPQHHHPIHTSFASITPV